MPGGEEKDLMDPQGSSSPGCCNNVGLTKDENAPKATPGPVPQGMQQLQPARTWAKGALRGLQQPLKLLRSKVQLWGNSTADTGPAGEAQPPPPPPPPCSPVFPARAEGDACAASPACCRLPPVL